MNRDMIEHARNILRARLVGNGAASLEQAHDLLDKGLQAASIPAALQDRMDSLARMVDFGIQNGKKNIIADLDLLQTLFSTR